MLGWIANIYRNDPYPDAPRMEYLPTFGSFIGSMLVNIPYMEHLGIFPMNNGEPAGHGATFPEFP